MSAALSSLNRTNSPSSVASSRGTAIPYTFHRISSDPARRFCSTSPISTVLTSERENCVLMEFCNRFRSSSFGFFLLLSFAASFVRADTAAFDLIGPKIEVRVQREGHTLPISQVPNLQAGDRLWVHPDLPESQSVHYVMVIAFLRGATNPPSDSWFTRVDSWNKRVREEGIFVTVPEGAEEALVFLAPETG